MDTNGDRHNPLFRKYLDKALQFAQPTDVPKGKEMQDVNGLAKYHQIVEAAKKVGDVANLQYNLVKQLDDNHRKVHELFSKIVLVENALRRFINEEQGTILLNDESKDLLEKLEDFYVKMKDLVVKSQEFVESGFDKINGINV